MTGGRVDLDRAISLAQLLTLLAGLLYFGLETGRRDESLRSTSVRVDELATIVADLTKSTVASAMKDSEHDRRLADIQDRLLRMESNR